MESSWASRLAAELFPAPAGPSIAMVIKTLPPIILVKWPVSKADCDLVEMEQADAKEYAHGYVILCAGDSDLATHIEPDSLVGDLGDGFAGRSRQPPPPDGTHP